MTAAQTLAFPQENLIGWERALYAFLVEKQRRSGSDRTVQGYSSMLQDFFGREGYIYPDSSCYPVKFVN